jgi:hypothetical protein
LTPGSPFKFPPRRSAQHCADAHEGLPPRKGTRVPEAPSRKRTHTAAAAEHDSFAAVPRSPGQASARAGAGAGARNRSRNRNIAVPYRQTPSPCGSVRRQPGGVERPGADRKAVSHVTGRGPIGVASREFVNEQPAERARFSHLWN